MNITPHAPLWLWILGSLLAAPGLVILFTVVWMRLTTARQSIKPHVSMPEIVTRMREIAHRLGWSLGIHGSMVRDYDLIAVPWTAEATHWRNLYNTFLAELPLKDTEGIRADLPPKRPFNRKSMLILQKGSVRLKPEHPKGAWNPPCIDISFMIPQEQMAQVTLTEATAESK